MATRPRKRPPRTSLALRWLAVGALVLVGLLYYRPVRTYFERRDAVAARQARVRALAERHAALERRLRYVSSKAAVARAALRRAPGGRRARRAPARLRDAGRAALHRQGDPGVASARAGRGYDRPE